jgi:hypothetical protein
MEKADVREHLAEADKKIEDAEIRIVEQRHRVEALADDGHSTEAAERLLATYNQVLEVMVKYKKTIASELETQPSIYSNRWSSTPDSGSR